jgi:hypothetical protein
MRRHENLNCKSLKGTDNLGDLDIYGRIILKWNVKEIKSKVVDSI